MSTRPNLSEAVPAVYANLLDADVVAGVATVSASGAPARRLVVGIVGASGVTLTRPDGTSVTMPAAQVIAFNGVITRQFIAVQSDDSTGLGVDY